MHSNYREICFNRRLNNLIIYRNIIRLALVLSIFFISIWWTTASMILMWRWIINEDTYIGRLYSFIKRLIYDRRRHMAKLETFYCNHDPKLQTQQQVNISFSALLSAFLGQIRWFVFSREKINSALFHIGVKHSQSWGRITIWLEKKISSMINCNGHVDSLHEQICWA